MTASPAGASGVVEVVVNYQVAGKGNITGEQTIMLSKPLVSGDLVEARQLVDGQMLESKAIRVQPADLTPFALHTPIHSDDTAITGTAPLVGGTVQITINGGSPHNATVGADGTFSVNIGSQTLQAGNLVSATFAKNGLSLKDQASVQPPATAPEVIITTVEEGATTVTGSARGDGFDTVRVEVIDGSDVKQSVDATYDPKQNTFSASLPNALVEGETVHVHLFNGKAEVGLKAGSNCNASGSSNIPGCDIATSIVQSLGYDWGRVKAYFTLGMIAVKQADSNAFGSPDAFVALNLDYNWWSSQKLPFCPEISRREYGLKTGQPKNGGPYYIDGQDKHSPESCSTGDHTDVLVNSYFEARLTQIPVNNGQVDPKTVLSGGAAFEGGIYAPILAGFSRWEYRGTKNAIFVAPLVKMGFQTLTGNTKDPNGSNDVQRFYGGGIRFGQFNMGVNPKSEAPELLSYLDVTGGKWDNFRYKGMIPWRLDVTGKFKIPRTVFYVGAGVNAGPGIDDLRIFFGARIDVGKMLGALIPSLK